MKKIGILLITLLLIIPAFGFAEVDIGEFEDAFTTFGNSVGPALPLAANIGLNWSDAYIGQLLGVPPRFGAGITLGAAFLPVEGFHEVLNILDQEALKDNLPEVGDMGVAFPVYTVEGRIGGFLLDFDLGLKAGWLPASEKVDDMSGDFDLEYTMIGADIRIPIIKQNILLPNVAIGAGFTYLKGGIGLDVGTIAFDGDGDPLTIENTRLGFEWETMVYDFKAQASKSFLLFTPYLGAGVSLHDSKAGGSLTGEAGGEYEGETFKLGDAGISGMIEVEDNLNFRMYGGTSINLFLLKLDLQGMYDFTSETLGASINARIQM